MKTLFFKSIVPIIVAVFGISGAFAVTSTNRVSQYDTPEVGYTRDPSGHCTEIAVFCDNTPSNFICRLNGTTGPQVFGIDPATHYCLKVLYRP